MTEFIWTPEFGASKTVKPSVTQIRFGDGYEQRLAFGINTVPQTWTLSFANRDAAEAGAIDAFLVARGAIEAFSWTPPDSATAYAFVCRSWESAPQKGGRFTITAMFEQVFEP